MMSTEDILEALGGRDAVAELTGAKPRAVEQWVRIGVPYRFWDLLECEAHRRGVQGINLKTLSATKKAAVAGLRQQRAAE